MAATSRVRCFLFSVGLVGLAVSVVSSVFFVSKIRERERYLSGLIESTLGEAGGLSPDDIAVRLSRAIYEKTRAGLRADELDWYSRWESTSFFNVTAAVSLRYGGFGVEGDPVYGPCGTMTRTLLNALWKLGIPARKLQLLENAEGKGGGHTMVEFYSGGRWLVISPSDGAFVWRTSTGDIATAEEIRKDPAIFSQIFAQRPGYPYLFDRYSNIRWEKVPLPVRTFFRKILGAERFENAKTPRLYDKPRTLFLWASVAALVFFGVMTYLTRPRRSAALAAAAR